MIITMPWPHPILNPNDKSHWTKKRRQKSAQVVNWYFACKDEKLPRGSYKFSIELCPPDNRKRDVDNCIASLKSGLDGLSQASGVDDSKFKIQWPAEFSAPRKGGAVIVTVLE